jgi:hypothetical protein
MTRSSAQEIYELFVRANYYCRRPRLAGPLPEPVRREVDRHHAREAHNGNELTYWKDLQAAVDTYNATALRPNEAPLTASDVTSVMADLTEPLGAPIVSKGRPIDRPGSNSDNHTLLPLDWDRLFRRSVRDAEAGDVAWSEKKDAAVWRGSTTGHWTVDYGRLALVSRWAGEAGQKIGVDVGIVGFIQGVARDKAIEKPRMTVAEQLRYRYIICVEGNDVSTGLTWAMASRSVVLMPKPRHESWLMEGRMKPWVHYVPLSRDFSDLGKALRWCRTNPSACAYISAQATKWVLDLCDPVKEAAVVSAVLRKFIHGSGDPEAHGSRAVSPGR